MMRRAVLTAFAVLAVFAALTCAGSAQVNPSLLGGLQWRNIGPLRAGRVAAVTGVIGQPGKFYIGLPGGGVWETDDAGITWRPIFDAVKDVSAVGAIEVAPSDARVIYAGTGDLITGLALNEGNGMYKSTDGGQTWSHSGLEHTHRIARILVDPHDPNLVLAAAQGDYHFKNADRGVFRSTDGGATWTKVLYRDDETGARDMAWAYDDPQVVFATTYLHYNPNPGLHSQEENGTGLYKSSDEGATWTAITGGGLPELSGRMAVAVAQGTHGQRVFLVGGFGLYRSDDGGATWTKSTNDGRITGNDYICGVYVDTQNPNVVYVMQTSMYRSTDGGHTFISFKGAPGGDDNHVLWIDPTNAQRILLGADQGAAVSLDWGRTWSPWYNQSTAQVYRIAADNQFPYWVYATQQDTGAVAVRSRGDLGEVTPFDWYPMPAGEAGGVAPDPLNPNVIYAGGLSSALVKVTRPLWGYQDVSPGGNGVSYRQFSNPPIAFLPQDPHTMYFGTQFVSVTHDGGEHWRDISPDLSAHHGQPPVAPAYGRPTPALAALSPSPARQGVIWTGSNNGLVYLTQDAGAHWKEVTPAGAPDTAEFNFVEPSHTNPAEAYAEMDNRNVGDYLPHIFRTRDYGAHWTEIVAGLPRDEPTGSFVRVVREDPKVPGLLYCGTESTVYVSFDDGDQWQSLRLNLPNSSIRDLVVHDNDLVIGTYGRGFWILDDMSPLRQLGHGTAGRISGDAAYFFQPGEAIRAYRDVNADTPFPPEVAHARNPPDGALLYYYLGTKPSGPITLEVRDAGGQLVRTLSSVPSAALAAFESEPQTVPDYWRQPLEPLPTAVGTNRTNWDLRYAAPVARLSLPMTAIVRDTPAAPQGPLAPPGVYTLTLRVDGQAYTRTLAVRNDPRRGQSPATMAGLEAQHALEMRILKALEVDHQAADQISAARAVPGASAQEGQLAALAGGGRGGRGGRGRGGNGPASLATAENELLGLLNLLDGPSDAPPTAAQMGTFERACTALNTTLAGWRSLAPQVAGAARLAVPAALTCGE